MEQKDRRIPRQGSELPGAARVNQPEPQGYGKEGGQWHHISGGTSPDMRACREQKHKNEEEDREDGGIP
jgi:hypothetical protein